MATAHAAATTMHREQEALIVVVATARKTLDDALACERAAALAWEKEKTIARHLEQQLTTNKGSRFPRTMMMIAPSTLAPTPTPSSPRTCMHRLLTSKTYDRWSQWFWNPRRPTTSGGAASCFSRFIATPSMTMSSPTSPIRPSIGLNWTTSW
jgi:hypothetical protein